MIPFKLEDYDLSQELGFLPARSPAKAQLPQSCQQLQQTATLLPKLLTTGKIRRVIANLPSVNFERETIDEMQLRRLMQVYSYLTHGYIWGEPTAIEVLPHNIAVPFYQIARQLILLMNLT
ncbi:hypothetical protein [Pleurocapsa sp. PCC 7319]|uniref:hypothetical protein n=1 Tax=Pleurocapsa sp. PCC 7319 TaxID=118161 RepID=UPI000349EBA9|nr:hypothetical protein [Pleurocapsa sp. PCC 7319]